MQTFLKAAISLLIILTATAIGKRFPSVAGLIAVMPLAGALIFVWMHLENRGNPQVMELFTKGAIWGFVPSLMFYLAAFFCLKRQLPLSIILLTCFAVWLIAASFHQWLLK
ncbi:conserved membrane hypothetical protein [uncultured Desulfobacterium sp.]|uniref:DUF3147 family protein n=1 Tax=uncultured Desulfobacterium sp. TaxID=201089 RepID=A0A445N1R8_9BACT|nr:conserved membrane hypothetical protein [uncultured Desulfobacterium sp.]